MIAFDTARLHSGSSFQGSFPTARMERSVLPAPIRDQFNSSLKFSGSIVVPEGVPQGYSLLLPGASRRDRAAIIEAAVLLYRLSFGRVHDAYLDDDIKYYRSKAKTNDLIVLKDDRTQRIVGTALLNPPFHGEDTLWISHFCIAEDYRGQKLGQDMMRIIQSLARQRPGIRKLKLEVLKNNQAAIRVYTKCGFRLDETLDRTAYYVYDLNG